MIIKQLHDDYGNTATIERVTNRPYRDAPHKETSYRLSLTADYNNDFLYHVSVYETLDEIDEKLTRISCGIWH